MQRSGFMYGRKSTPKTKQPFAIALKDNSIFAFAGLWERCKDKATGQRLETYTIFTTDSNELVEPFTTECRSSLRQETMCDGWLLPTRHIYQLTCSDHFPLRR